MDSYRSEKQAVQEIQLADGDAVIEPAPTAGGGQKPEPELNRLSSILRDFNDRFGNIEWKDQDKIERVIAEELPVKVAADKAYQNAMANSDQQNARIEHDRALNRAMNDLLVDHAELLKQFSDNESFHRWLSEMTFAATYRRAAGDCQHCQVVHDLLMNTGCIGAEGWRLSNPPHPRRKGASRTAAGSRSASVVCNRGNQAAVDPRRTGMSASANPCATACLPTWRRCAVVPLGRRCGRPPPTRQSRPRCTEREAGAEHLRDPHLHFVNLVVCHSVYSLA